MARIESKFFLILKVFVIVSYRILGSFLIFLIQFLETTFDLYSFLDGWHILKEHSGIVDLKVVTMLAG